MTRFVCPDFETHRVRDGMVAPRLVVGGFSERVAPGTSVAGISTAVLLRPQAIEMTRRLLLDPDVVLVNVELGYDLLVACAEDEDLVTPVFDAVDALRVRCIVARQMLIDISRGDRDFRPLLHGKRSKRVKSEYGLDDLAMHWLGETLEKKDTWRLRYGELDGVPLPEWPPEAVDYVAKDSTTGLRIFEAQEAHVAVAEELVFRDPAKGRELRGLLDEKLQQRATWALKLMGCWGPRVDRGEVASLRREYEDLIAACRADLLATGIVRDDGTRDMKRIRDLVRAMHEARGLAPPLTRGGEVSTAAEILAELDDPQLERMVEMNKATKFLSTYVVPMERAIDRPLCGSFVPVVSNGRTSMRRPNLQNLPRKGRVRDCFIPRAGRLFLDVDYDTIEMRSLAQVCLDLLGWSSMADALRRGEDLHLKVAAEVMGTSLEEVTRLYEAGDEDAADARQVSKPANFGLGGGMGAETFVAFCRSQGIKLAPTLADAIKRAVAIKASWLKAFPEMHDYFRLVGAIVGERGEGRFHQLRSLRARGRTSFTETANGLWSGLAADGSKSALWRVSRACYTGRCDRCKGLGYVPVVVGGYGADDVACEVCDGSGVSPLAGCRPVLYTHDQITTEVPDAPDLARPAAAEQTRIMIAEMGRWLPSVPVRAKPILMRRWYKGARPVLVDGLLVPSRPERDERNRTTWVRDGGVAWTS